MEIIELILGIILIAVPVLFIIVCVISIRDKKAVKREKNNMSASRSENMDEVDYSSISEELKGKVKELLEENRKIEAIKIVREETGMSLYDAKNYVDNF